MTSTRFFSVHTNGSLIILIFVKINLTDYEAKFFPHGGGFYHFLSVVIFCTVRNRERRIHSYNRFAFKLRCMCFSFAYSLRQSKRL